MWFYSCGYLKFLIRIFTFCRFLRILYTKFKHVFFSIVTFDTQKWAIIILLRLRYTHLIIHQKGIVITIEKEANLPHVGWWVVLDLWVQLTIGSFVGMQLYIVYAVCTWTWYVSCMDIFYSQWTSEPNNDILIWYLFFLKNYYFELW